MTADEKVRALKALQEDIQAARDGRELKRALAVQNTLKGRPWAEVAAELGVTKAFVCKWRARYTRDGVAGLRVGYRHTHQAKGLPLSGEAAKFPSWEG